MNSEHDFEALTRLLLGEVDAAERARLEAWLAEDPAAREHYESLAETATLLREVVVPELSTAGSSVASGAVARDAALSADRRANILAATERPVGSANVTPISRIPARRRSPDGWVSSSLAAAVLLGVVVMFTASMRSGDEGGSPEYSGPRVGELRYGNTAEILANGDVLVVQADDDRILASLEEVVIFEAPPAPEMASLTAPRGSAMTPGANGSTREDAERLRTELAAVHAGTAVDARVAAPAKTPTLALVQQQQQVPVPDLRVRTVALPVREGASVGGGGAPAPEVTFRLGYTGDAPKSKDGLVDRYGMAPFETVDELRLVDGLAALPETQALALTLTELELHERIVVDPAGVSREEDDPAEFIPDAEDATVRRTVPVDALVTSIMDRLTWQPGELPEQYFYRIWGDQPFVDASRDPVSTFGIDVDTASYSIARKHLYNGMLPPPQAIRTEEFVNAMPRRLPPPNEGDLGLHLELATSELAHRPGVFLLEVGVKAREVSNAERKPVALTVVLDVSGSMKKESRLAIVKESLVTLLDSLDARDTIGIVSFANEARVVLEPVSALDHARVIAAFDALVADGSTNVHDGLIEGYAMAERQFRADASNRVLLFSDGIANTGSTEVGAMLEATAGAREKGIDCNTFGVGMSSHDDHLMEQLADRGNGVNAYLDDGIEAERLFGVDFTATFETVARDAKIQVEFHPGVVAHYRQVGYENRAIADADFRNDAVDAGEVGAGHQVVALYEVELHEVGDGPLATARVRYHSTTEDAVVEIEDTIDSTAIVDFFAASDGLRLSACAASFAEVLRGSTWARNATIGEIIEVASPLVGRFDTPEDPSVAEFVEMLTLAEPLEEARAEDAMASILDRVRDIEHRRAQLETRRTELEGVEGGTDEEQVLRKKQAIDLGFEIEKLIEQRDALRGDLEEFLSGR